MIELWMMVLLISPTSGDGLITGWSALYPTFQECEGARIEAEKHQAQSKNYYVVSTCQKVK